MKTKRVLYFDILNIIAIIAVVALHMNGIVHKNPGIRAWNTSLIVECLFYFAVPIFIMLSGANLLNYRDRYDTKTFFKKRFLKVLIPYLFWAIFMFIWKTKTNQLTLDWNFKNVLNAFFNNKEESTYYFMQIILGLYLTIPFLSLTAKKENSKTLLLTIILYFIFNAIFVGVLPLIGINYNSRISIQLSGYIIYLFLGYLLANFEVPKKYRIMIYISALLGLIYRYSTTFYFSKQLGKVYKDNWGYGSWHCFLLAISVFLIIKNINFIKLEQNKTAVKIIKEVSGCSFGIYLIHFIVRYYLLDLLNLSEYAWQARTLGIVLVYLISLIIVFVIKRIPILKKVVP